MTPQEFKQARQSLGLSQSQIAAILGMGDSGDRTVRKWENGERSPNQIACTAVQWLVEGTRPADLLERKA